MDMQPLLDALKVRGHDVHLFDLEGVPHVAVPAGLNVQHLDIEKHMPAPKAIRREVGAHDIRGFVDYVNKFQDVTTQLYCDPVARPGVLARLDDHTPGKPSHITHACRYPCPTTHEWQTWMKANGQPMGQKAFALFLEKNQRDVIKPGGAEMLTMVTNFRDVREVDFQQAIRISSSRVEFNFTQKDVAGKVALPETFDIGIPVFEGVEMAYPLTVRLRYQIKEQELTLWIDLDRPDVVLRTAYDDVITRIEKETSLKVFRAV